MTETENAARPPVAKIEGEILLFDPQGDSHRTRIKDCLTLINGDGQRLAPKYAADGTFTAELIGASPFKLQAAFEDKKYVFAFDTAVDPTVMPTLEIAVTAGTQGIRLFAWEPPKSHFGHDAAIDARFARDTSKACIALYNAMIADGKTEAEAWHEVERILKTAFEADLPAALPCKTCRDRYYTVGTPYYMNYPAYDTCCFRPPCT